MGKLSSFTRRHEPAGLEEFTFIARQSGPCSHCGARLEGGTRVYELYSLPGRVPLPTYQRCCAACRTGFVAGAAGEGS